MSNLDVDIHCIQSYSQIATQHYAEGYEHVIGSHTPEPGDDEHDEADDEVGGDDVEPDLDGERVEEREEAGTLALGPLEEDADAEVHERLREVDGLLADPADRQRRHRQVRFL